MIIPVAAEEPPRIVVPAPRQVSFGRIVVRVPSGTRNVILLVDGKPVLERQTHRRRVTIRYQLPRRDVTLRLVAIDGRGALTRSHRVGPVLGLPRRAAPRPSGSREHASLARSLRRQMRSFPGVSAVYVRDLVTGSGAGWNATAEFPAGSTLKVALALEALRVSDGPPRPSSELGRLLEGTIANSSNIDANDLAIAIAGSTGLASARVNALMARVGLTGSDLFGGYLVEDEELAARGLTGRGHPTRASASAYGLPGLPPRWPPSIRLETVRQPDFGRGKRTSAADLSRLFAAIHLAAGGRGPLIKHYGRQITAAEARHLLYLLVHTQDRGTKLAAQIPRATIAHKAGWISTARHDAGIVYWKGGAFVAAVMTFNAAGVGPTADRLAARAARTSLTTFRG